MRNLTLALCLCGLSALASAQATPPASAPKPGVKAPLPPGMYKKEKADEPVVMQNGLAANCKEVNGQKVCTLK